jgi:hypothetical protein
MYKQLIFTFSTSRMVKVKNCQKLMQMFLEIQLYKDTVSYYILVIIQLTQWSICVHNFYFSCLQVATHDFKLVTLFIIFNTQKSVIEL